MIIAVIGKYYYLERDAGNVEHQYRNRTVIVLTAIQKTLGILLRRDIMLPIATKKFCCGGGNAIMIEPLWPMKRRGKKFFMALFQCKTCGEYTLRGENQEKMWNTFVEVLNEKRAKQYIEEKKQRIKQ